MANNFKDFDEFFGEMEKKPLLEIKLYGKTYELPAELPATTMLETYNAYKNGAAEISDAKQFEIAINMIGEDVVKEWCDNGLTVSQLTDIMMWIVEQHTGGKATEGTGASNGKK